MSEIVLLAAQKHAASMTGVHDKDSPVQEPPLSLHQGTNVHSSEGQTMSAQFTQVSPPAVLVLFTAVALSHLMDHRCISKYIASL